MSHNHGWTMIFGASAARLGQGLRGLPWWDSPMLPGSGTTGDPRLGAVTAHPATLRGQKSLGNTPRKLLQRLRDGCHCCIILHKTFGNKVINKVMLSGIDVFCVTAPVQRWAGGLPPPSQPCHKPGRTRLQEPSKTFIYSIFFHTKFRRTEEQK